MNGLLKFIYYYYFIDLQDSHINKKKVYYINQYTGTLVVTNYVIFEIVHSRKRIVVVVGTCMLPIQRHHVTE